MDIIDYGYSLNGEEYYDYDYIIDRINDDYPKGESVEVYKGESVKWSHVYTLFDNMEENAYEEAGEYADSYEVRPTKEKAEELEKIISNWCDKILRGLISGQLKM